MTKPDDIPQDIWGAACDCWETLASSAPLRDHETVVIARAIMAAKADKETEIAGLLHNPVAVRLNWLRGGIDASSIIAEEREACALEMDRRATENANTLDTQAAYRNAAAAIRKRRLS